MARANEGGDTTDDEVYVDLWPNGVNGFYYQFAANPIGTHWQYSSENTAYSPTWSSFGAPHAGGFTTTMAIPLKALRGAGNTPIRMRGPCRSPRMASPALALALSGAGPSVIALVSGESESIGDAMQAAFAREAIDSDVFHLGISTQGATVEPLAAALKSVAGGSA